MRYNHPIINHAAVVFSLRLAIPRSWGGERGLCLTILATFALSVYFLLGEAVRKGRRKWIIFMEESPCSVYLSLSVLQVDISFNISEDITKRSRDNC